MWLCDSDSASSPSRSLADAAMNHTGGVNHVAGPEAPGQRGPSSQAGRSQGVEAVSRELLQTFQNCCGSPSGGTLMYVRNRSSRHGVGSGMEVEVEGDARMILRFLVA